LVDVVSVWGGTLMYLLIDNWNLFPQYRIQPTKWPEKELVKEAFKEQVKKEDGRVGDIPFCRFSFFPFVFLSFFFFFFLFSVYPHSDESSSSLAHLHLRPQWTSSFQWAVGFMAAVCCQINCCVSVPGLLLLFSASVLSRRSVGVSVCAQAASSIQSVVRSCV
jgi:hypothetical protein